MADTIALSPTVSFAGSPLASAFQAALLELRVERALNVPGRVTMRFADPGYALLASGTVALEATVTVSDPSGTQTLLEGIVTGIGCDQREGEQPELVVVAHDHSYTLGLTSRVKTWSQTTLSGILQDVLSESTLHAKTDVSPDPTFPYLLQVDTDLGILGELVRRVGADWWVTGSTLVVAQPNGGGGGSVTLTLGDGLLAFSARAMPAPASVTVTGWDYTHQVTVVGQSTDPTTGVVPTSTLGKLATPSGAFVTAAVGARTSTEASALSQALFDLRAGAAVEATGTAAGNGALAPGATVTVTGAGPLNGTYALSAVEHIYRPRRGFLTRFRSGDRRPAGLVDGGRPATNALNGSIVGHQGVTVGVVTNIKDTTTSGRVKVRFPGMGSTQESAWARVVATGGGSTRGNVFLPEVDDEVLVAFEDGDTRAPVVIGGLYSSKSKIPAPTLKTGKVQRREMVSRLGHVIRFLDGTETADKAIELELAGKENSIHMGQDKTTVTVKSGNQLSITVGSTSITVAASTGALSIKAGTIQIKATKQLELSAPKIVVTAASTLTVKANTKVGVTGTLVQVKANAMLGLTGTPVSINGG